MRLRLAFAVGMVCAASLHANTYTVTATADSGAGSLRQAILDANANPGADMIAFNITGSGVQTITPASPLPTVTEAVTINGYSQPGASANTNGPSQGTNAVILIEIDGENIGFGNSGLTVGAAGVTIRGLAINRCNEAGIYVNASGGGTVVAGNFLGTDPTGATRPGAQQYGVEIEGANTVVVGGTNPADRNVLSANDAAHVLVGDAGGNNTIIQGNLIGTDATGAIGLPGQFDYANVYIRLGTGQMIGGPTAAERNIIAGNIHGSGVGVGYTVGGTTAVATIQGNFIGTDVSGTLPLGNQYGLSLPDLGSTILGNVISANLIQAIVSEGGSSETIQGNFIGTDVTGTVNLGNVQGVVAIGGNNWVIGGPNPGEGNVIAFNGSPYTIAIGSGSGNTIRGNSMYDNAALGIDLYAGGSPGVTPPTPCNSSNVGPNNLQNFPIIKSVTPNASTTTIQGILNSTASTTFDIDLYATAACINVPQAYVEGEFYLGTFQITTDGSCNASFSHDVPVVIQPGQIVTATATDPNGNTSEFSQRLIFSQSPASGPAAGGTSATLTGMLFESGATVTVGGVPATNVNFVSSSSITATMPARPAGSVNDTVVSNPSGTGGTLRNGWIADFLDVPPSQLFYSYVTTLVSNAITAGLGDGTYGVNDNTERQQMAVFILKAKHGLCFVPPICTGIFLDVPCPSQFANWIEELANEHITSGCDATHFCPSDNVRRDQMSVFLLKAKHGSTYVPPSCTGLFLDVTCPSQFANWIEEFANEHITGGCDATHYCPADPSTRGQMAVFIVKTFNLQ